MKSLNQCNFIGNLGKDPETRYTAAGTCVCSFSIAVSEDYKNRDGDKVEKTEWVKCVAWDKLGEICEEYLKKGSKVFISGRLQTRSWEQDGIKRYASEIVVETMQMLGSPADREESAPARNNGDQKRSTRQPSAVNKDDPRTTRTSVKSKVPQEIDDFYDDTDVPF